MTDAGGPSQEALTLLATLVHRVPGKWVGHAVLSNTFRHPAVLAKAATVLDHATGGRFVLGLGAGWHVFEHRTFGIPAATDRRADRSARVGGRGDHRPLLARGRLTAGHHPAGSFYPLEDATNVPPPLTPGGPPIFLGGQGKRGIGLAVGRQTAGICPASTPATSATSRRSARSCSARLRPRAVPPRTSRGSGRCTSAHRLRIESARSRRAWR